MTNPKGVDKIGRIALIVLIVGFVWLAYQQTIQPLLAARKDLGAFKEAVQILSDAEGSVNRLNGEIDQASRQIAQNEPLLPREIDLDAFLEQLGDLAASTQVRVDRFSPHPLVAQRLYRELPLEVSLSGPFIGVYNFLYQLEKGSRLSRVDRLAIRFNEPQRQCKANMRLTLFYAGEEEH
jgi:Tfp pilus assembly protein PilO